MKKLSWIALLLSACSSSEPEVVVLPGPAISVAESTDPALVLDPATGDVLMSWVDPTFSKPVGQFLFSITEPVLAPIRKVLPQTGMFDFSPLIVLLVLSMLIRLVAL